MSRVLNLVARSAALADWRAVRLRATNAPLFQHVVNVSGGKDSDCCYQLAVLRGQPFRAIFADTGNEHDWTYEHVDRLAERVGGPPIEVVKQDFTEALARRRDRLPEQWRAVGIPEAYIERALQILVPTGTPYLDMVLSKGMFAAGARRKFCTEILKVWPSDEQVVKPLLADGINVIQWLGIRHQESEKRQEYPRFDLGRPVVLDERTRALILAGKDVLGMARYPRPRMTYYRPLIDWTVEDVVELHRHFGLPMNPLYREGFERVGCFPCINETKASMAIITKRFPEHVDRIREWEALCTEVNVAWKNEGSFGDVCTFFPAGKIPRAARNPIDDVAAWSLTKRGGRSGDLLAGWGGAQGPLADEQIYACTGGRGDCE